jgi:Mn2+/Fe2+ NRAMP family transporter
MGSLVNTLAQHTRTCKLALTVHFHLQLQLQLVVQVILSVTLTFAVAPLVHLTSTRAKMGFFVNGWATTIVATALTVVIGGVNIFLVVQAARGAIG